MWLFLCHINSIYFIWNKEKVARHQYFTRKVRSFLAVTVTLKSHSTKSCNLYTLRSKTQTTTPLRMKHSPWLVLLLLISDPKSALWCYLDFGFWPLNLNLRLYLLSGCQSLTATAMCFTLSKQDFSSISCLANRHVLKLKTGIQRKDLRWLKGKLELSIPWM